MTGMSRAGRMSGPGTPMPGATTPWAQRSQRWIRCRFCGHDNPVGGDTCENCGAEFSEGVPEAPASFEGRLLGTRLGALATGDVLQLDGSVDAFDAVARMKAENRDCVLVTEQDRLEGIFTDRDAMDRLAAARPPGPPLRDVMTPHPDVLLAADTVALAIHTMAVGRLRHVPVLRDDGSISVVAAKDLFRHLAARPA